MSKDITRRQALTVGAIGVGTVCVGAAGLAISSWSSRRDDRAFAPNPPDAAGSSGEVSWSEPSVLESVDGVLEVVLQIDEREVAIAGRSVRMLTYNGTVPGPTLHLRPGDVLRIRLQNGLADPTNLHTHGLRVSPSDNGDNPFVRVGAGQGLDYEFELPEDHPAGVSWYHPHHHGSVADQLFGGLYGAIIVDEEDWSLVPPRITVVSDVTISGGLVAAASAPERISGRTGDILLTNGNRSPSLRAPEGSEQRFLIVNACVSRYLDLQLSDLDARVRGIDSDRRTQQTVNRLVLAPGNRADLVITTPEHATDLVAAGYDRGRAAMGMMGGGSATSADAVVLTTIPDASAVAPVVAAEDTRARRDLRQSPIDASRTLTMTMGMGGGAGMTFLIDGNAFDPDRVDQSVAIGTVEEWTIINASPMDHPFHLHVWPMQVMRVAGNDVADVEVRDVIDVPAGSSVVVRVAFDRFPGRTVYHCHILDHEDLGMMGVIEAV